MSLPKYRFLFFVVTLAGAGSTLHLAALVSVTQAAVISISAEDQESRGVVIETSESEVTIEHAEGKATFHAGPDNQLAQHELKQLRSGDEITIAWIEEGEKRWIRDIEGRGVIEGKVTGLGDRWIEVTAGDKRPLKLIPPWIGGNPDQGGGLDKEILQKLGTLRVGNRVRLVWEMPEGKRVVAVEKLDSAPSDSSEGEQGFKPLPEGVRGFRGIFFGTISEIDRERGTFQLKVSEVGRVWEQSKASEPETAVGKVFRIKLSRESRLVDQHFETLKDLRDGDRVQVEVFHLDEGVLTVMELLKKAE